MISHRIKIRILLLSVFILNGANAQVIFEDYFTDGTADQWTEMRGNWDVINQEYTGYLDAPSPASDLYTKTGDMSWSNYIFEAQMKFVLTKPEWNDFGLVFYDQGNEYIRFTLGNEEAPPTARISYQKYNTSSGEFETVEELATVVSEPLMVSGAWYDVRLSVYNDYVYAYVNDILVAYADNLPLTHGNIGLIADDATVSFDNIVVTNNASPTYPLSGWVWMESSSDFGYSLDEGDLLYFYSSEPVWYYNFTTSLWNTEGPNNWIYVDWPFIYELDTGDLWFALPPVDGLWVYHFSTSQWLISPQIIP